MTTVPASRLPAPPLPFNARRRKWINRLAMAVMSGMLLLCLVPLASVLYELLSMGLKSISPAFLVNLPLHDPPGIGNAILGSVLILLVASAFSVPAGLLGGLYLSQRAQTRTAQVSRLLLDAMSGIPAIVVGMFVYSLLVQPMGGASLLAGGVSLAMIMLPILTRTTEEALKAIPHTVTEAGLGLGLPRRTVILRVLVRSAMPAMVTGFFLSLARVGGEAAPLLFTALASNNWPTAGPRAITEQIASLPVVIYELARQPFPDLYVLAWGASLVLVMLILIVRLTANLYVRWHYGQRGAIL